MERPMEIIISDKTFMGIVPSSIEVFRHECLGVLFGHETRDRIVIEYAIPLQSAERHYSKVFLDLCRECEVIEILPRLMHLKKLVYFNSHTEHGNSRAEAKLSEQDKESMNDGEIELVVAVNGSKMMDFWNEAQNGELYGTLGKYRVNIGGFYKRKRTGKSDSTE